jgi:outer membrane receptor for ferrienterochelin and colicin
MKRILLPALLFYHLLSWAQRPDQKVLLKGKVIDSASNTPVNVTVTLIDKKNAAVLRTLATGTNGTFEIPAPAGRAYIIQLTAVGYRSKDTLLTAGDTKRPVLDLGPISMAIAETALKDVVVTAGRPVVKQEIDRISYDVQADPDSKASDALEMLRKVPMVTVDANDIVQLKGSANFQIFINGKPSALMTASPSDVLKAIPAAAIQKIEVITVPPSKYDAEGLTGIINIITLKSTTDGINGSLFARYNSVFGERGSVSLNVSKDRFSLTGLLGLGRQPVLTSAVGSTLTSYSPESVLSQQGQRSQGGNFNNGKTDLSYELDSCNLLTASADFFNRRFNQVTSTYSELVNSPDSVTQSYLLRNTGPVTAGALDCSVGYQLRFGPSKGRSLTFSYRYASTSNSQGNTVTASDGMNYTGSNYVQANSLRTVTHNFEIGFIRPGNRMIIEAGAKAILGRNDSHFSDDTLDQATGQNNMDTSLTNDFSYHQNVYSLYNSYHLKLPGWELKAGLRLENTVIKSSYGQSQTPISQDFYTLLPALSFQRYLAANNNITLGYTQRLQRALAAQLNPFVDKSNPSFIVTGNPALRPVVNNIIELDYSRSARLSVNASLDYTFSNDPIQNITGLLSDSVSESTWQNVGRNRTAGIHLTLNYPIFSQLSLILNTQLSHVWITGTYNSEFYTNDGTQGNVAASARYNFGHQLTASINFNYNSGNVYLQGRSSSYTYVGFNVIREFLKKRAALSITAFSPWSKYAQYSANTGTPAFSQETYGQFYNRNFRFAFNYKFGRLNADRKKAGGEEE